MKKNYAGIEDQYGKFEKAKILLQSVPYDGTSSWGKGADKGFKAFLEASENMELYDIETDSEVYKQGVHILPEVNEDSSPEAVYEACLKAGREALSSGKFPTFFGGEHSISIGLIEAFREKYNDLTVLQLDAHTDLRKSYMGSEYNHACALHKASKTTNLIQVGIRSMDVSEKKFIDWSKCFLAEEMDSEEDWMDTSIAMMGDQVYLTLDLDVFDPSIMPSTGTPEPGGMDWYTVMRYLQKVFEQKEVVGFDIVELAPIDDLPAPNFLVAKLYYKLLSYKFQKHD
jgi:agmatinase